MSTATPIMLTALALAAPGRLSGFESGAAHAHDCFRADVADPDDVARTGIASLIVFVTRADGAVRVYAHAADRTQVWNRTLDELRAAADEDAAISAYEDGAPDDDVPGIHGGLHNDSMGV